MRFSENVITDFISACEKLDSVIEAYGLKKEHILKEAKFTRGTFYNKLKKKDFTGQELLRIAKAINK